MGWRRQGGWAVQCAADQAIGRPTAPRLIEGPRRLPGRRCATALCPRGRPRARTLTVPTFFRLAAPRADIDRSTHTDYCTAFLVRTRHRTFVTFTLRALLYAPKTPWASARRAGPGRRGTASRVSPGVLLAADLSTPPRCADATTMGGGGDPVLARRHAGRERVSDRSEHIAWHSSEVQL